jgi:hypothetical protein
MLAVIIAMQMVGPLMRDVALDISHATERHGSDATIARQCLDGRSSQLFLNPKLDRKATVCEIDGAWGVVITDRAGNEITAFLKNKMRRFEQVLKYMQNQGYGVVH